MPQWLPGGNNLGDYTVETVRYNGAGLLAFMQEKPLYADAVAQIVGGQSHIMFGSKLGQRIASEGIVKRGIELVVDKATGERKEVKFDEKDADWRERVFQIVKDNAKAKLPGATFDYCAELRRWAEEEYANKGQKADKRQVLSDYYKITGSIEKGWAEGSDEKKVNLVAKLGLAPELAAGSTAEVLTAIAAKYKPEKVEVKEDDLF